VAVVAVASVGIVRFNRRFIESQLIKQSSRKADLFPKQFTKMNSSIASILTLALVALFSVSQIASAGPPVVVVVL
jgi:hypothetical protein